MLSEALDPEPQTLEALLSEAALEQQAMQLTMECPKPQLSRVSVSRRRVQDFGYGICCS